MAGMGQVLQFVVEFNLACYCCVCDVPVFMSSANERERRRTHASFYCVNGHSQSWQGKSDEEKLREELARKDRLLAAESQRAATNYAAREKAERALKKAQKRVAGGVCVECNRSFPKLARHMATKHPDAIAEARKP